MRLSENEVVSQPNGPVILDENVLRLDISVGDLQTVKVGHHWNELLRIPSECVFWDKGSWSWVNEVIEIALRAPLEDQAKVAVLVVENVVEVENEGMDEGGVEFELSLNQVPRLLVLAFEI